MSMKPNAKTVLEVKDLQTYFKTDAGIVKAVDGVSFSVREGETIGIVGESGSGKSVTNLSLMRLIPSPQEELLVEKSSLKDKTSSSSLRNKCEASEERRFP